MVLGSFGFTSSKQRRLSVAGLAFLAVSAMPLQADAQGVADPLLTGAVLALQRVQDAGFAVAEIALGEIAVGMQTFAYGSVPNSNAAISGAVVGSSTLQNDWISKHADYTAGQNQVTYAQQNAARYQADAMMPSQSSACAVQSYLQSSRQMIEDAHGISGTFTSLIALGECKGANADCHSPAFVREKIFDLCYLGFVPPAQNGDMFGQLGMNCPDISALYPGIQNGQHYIDAHNNMALLIDTVQMPVAPFCLLPDGYPYFSGTLPPGMNVACVPPTTLTKPTYSADPSQSQLAWVAAYKFCEGLSDPPSTPIYTTNRTITDIDYAAWLRDQHRATMEANASPRKLCMTYLWERTAFPTSGGPVATSVNGATTAAQDQANICGILFQQPNPNSNDTAGIGGTAQALTATGLGFGASDPLVQNCVNNGTGLSYLAMKMAKHYRCADTQYLPNYAEAIGKSDKVEKNATGDCMKEADTFEAYREHEREALSRLIARTGQRVAGQDMQTGPHSRDPAATPPNPSPGASPASVVP